MTERAASAKERDACLAGRLRAGDEQAFDALLARYRTRVYAFALKRVRHPSEAEDVVQDVFLQVFRSIDRYEGRSSLLTWIFGIAHHEVCNRYRRRRLELAGLDGEASRVADPAAPVDERVDAARALRRCARVLEQAVSPTQRRIFAMRFAGAQPVGAIARKLRKSQGAVRIGLSRTRRALREAAPEVPALLAS